MRGEGQPYVYFVRPVGKQGPVKIGRSHVPANRLETLMMWSPIDLEIVATIPGDFSLECRIHTLFAKDHTRREWFKASRRLSAFIEAIKAGQPIETLVDFSLPVTSLQKGRKRNYSADRRLYLSYAARVRHAFRKISGDALSERVFAPTDVDHILNAWSGNYKTASVSPTKQERARLDQVLANPRKFAVRFEKKWPRRAAVASTFEPVGAGQ